MEINLVMCDMETKRRQFAIPGSEEQWKADQTQTNNLVFQLAQFLAGKKEVHTRVREKFYQISKLNLKLPSLERDNDRNNHCHFHDLRTVSRFECVKIRCKFLIRR